MQKEGVVGGAGSRQLAEGRLGRQVSLERILARADDADVAELRIAGKDPYRRAVRILDADVGQRDIGAVDLKRRLIPASIARTVIVSAVEDVDVVQCRCT